LHCADPPFRRLHCGRLHSGFTPSGTCTYASVSINARYPAEHSAYGARPTHPHNGHASIKVTFSRFRLFDEIAGEKRK
ncbi:MAG: hypothetical protein MJZ85_02335, partial [Bacteroidales bacterium]|nr:hypothetical protein [Bacteroidales bacterium]